MPLWVHDRGAAIIAARSVVIKNVEENTVVGKPNRIYKNKY
jgi:acetyltransferase-like isoleucine patch superfamily enzyme